MLRTKTLLILGAGASCDFGMPLGKDLAGHIARKVDIRFKDGHQMTSGDGVIMEALRQTARQKNEDVNDYLHAGRLVRDGIDFTRSIDSFCINMRTSRSFNSARSWLLHKSLQSTNAAVR